jgi:hypothetical protein
LDNAADLSATDQRPYGDGIDALGKSFGASERQTGHDRDDVERRQFGHRSRMGPETWCLSAVVHSLARPDQPGPTNARVADQTGPINAWVADQTGPISAWVTDQEGPINANGTSGRIWRQSRR